MRIRVWQTSMPRPPSGHHRAHGNYPSEKADGRALSAETMAVLDQDDARREAEYQRYLALRESPEYQQALAAARERLAQKGGAR